MNKHAPERRKHQHQRRMRPRHLDDRRRTQVRCAPVQAIFLFNEERLPQRKKGQKAALEHPQGNDALQGRIRRHQQT